MSFNLSTYQEHMKQGVGLWLRRQPQCPLYVGSVCV